MSKSSRQHFMKAKCLETVAISKSFGTNLYHTTGLMSSDWDNVRYCRQGTETIEPIFIKTVHLTNGLKTTFGFIETFISCKSWTHTVQPKQCHGNWPFPTSTGCRENIIKSIYFLRYVSVTYSRKICYNIVLRLNQGDVTFSCYSIYFQRFTGGGPLDHPLPWG